MKAASAMLRSAADLLKYRATRLRSRRAVAIVNLIEIHLQNLVFGEATFELQRQECRL
jgi:hypothetical protein